MRWLLVLSLFWNGASFWTRQTGIELTDVRVRHAFGEWIEFQAQVRPDLPLAEAQIVISSQAAAGSQVLDVAVEPGNHLITVYDLSQQNWIKSFATIRYRYMLTFRSGERIESQEFTYVYSDNRFTWQSLAPAPNLSINWVQGDLAFGQSLADTAQLGIERFAQSANFTQREPIALYIYPDPVALQSALNLGTDLSAVGHAAGEAGLAWAAVAAGPEQNLEMESQIPHELAHVLLYQSVGANYGRIPAWLNEGLASAVELYPNPDYALVISRARERNALFTFESLCGGFPQDAAGAILAYAQSDSFIRYILESYGPVGLQDMILSYANGAACDEGPQPATGYTLAQLESRWRRTELNDSTTALALDVLIPWVLFGTLFLLAPLVGILRHLRKA
ncbi:MAG: hypothetical protein HYZ26_12510 [Chloroflexi bacterium]|nr:hypothetical protein [Chloroflexota bacterium]